MARSTTKIFRIGAMVSVGGLLAYGLYASNAWHEFVTTWPSMDDSLRTLIVALGGGALGFSLSLISTWLANRHSRQLQRDQFTFDSRERQAERHQQLRREVYLPAAEASLAIMSVFGKTADMNVPDSELTKHLEPFNLAVARVQLVAKPETVRLVSEAHRAVMVEYFRCMKSRTSLRFRQIDIDIASNMQKQHAADVSRWVEMMRQYNIEGSRDVERWEAIQRQAKFSEEQRDEASKEWNKLTKVHLREILSIVREAPPRIVPVLKRLNPALVAMRTELEMEPAQEVLEQELEKNSEEMIRQLQAFADSLEQTLNAAMAD